ncbi:MAG: phosphoribosylglycinamide formyltransferase [Clostridia bacterium]|nr:phosphoribosylglycinamide formyltransferase [Clostridia bacterium]
MKKIAVFVSGGGTDLQSIIDAVKSGDLKVEIALVIASKAGIFAIKRAEEAGIPVSVYEKKNYETIEEMYDELIDELNEKGVEFIVLAGYLTILTSNIINAFRRKIVNIHPALLPKFGGHGYYGMRVHKEVILAGETESGATVHYVDEGTDTGEIISQIKVPVYPYDTPETLQARVLEKEHELLPNTLKKLLNE